LGLVRVANEKGRATVFDHNRLIRRLWQAKKIVVNRLIRVRFYDILLPRSLDSGKYIELGTKDINKLKNGEKIWMSAKGFWSSMMNPSV
jgi:16S rRNA U516 pseudouridylate synthase RsuA-like enzyme